MLAVSFTAAAPAAVNRIWDDQEGVRITEEQHEGGGENETRALDMHAKEQVVSYPGTSLSPEKWQHVSLHSIAHLPSPPTSSSWSCSLLRENVTTPNQITVTNSGDGDCGKKAIREGKTDEEIKGPEEEDDIIRGKLHQHEKEEEGEEGRRRLEGLVAANNEGHCEGHVTHMEEDAEAKKKDEEKEEQDDAKKRKKKEEQEEEKEDEGGEGAQEQEEEGKGREEEETRHTATRTVSLDSWQCEPVERGQREVRRSRHQGRGDVNDSEDMSFSHTTTASPSAPRSDRTKDEEGGGTWEQILLRSTAFEDQKSAGMW